MPSSRRRPGSCGRATNSDNGQAAEHLTAADLLHRGLFVTKPLNTNGPHDLHVRVRGVWITIQVKTGQVGMDSGTITIRTPKSGITSDIIAAVDLQTMRVRYLPNEQPVPEELLNGQVPNVPHAPEP